MSRTVGRCLVGLILAAGALWAAAAFLVSPSGLETLVRPLFVHLVSSKTGAAVTLDGIERTVSGLRFTGFELDAPGGKRLRVARLEADFSWRGILRRRVDSVTVSEPVLSLPLETGPALAEEGGRNIPGVPSVSLGRGEIRGGSAVLVHGDAQVVLRGIDMVLDGFPLGSFQFSMQVGGADGAMFRGTGRISWDRVPSLEITGAEFAGRQLVRSPLRFALPSGSPRGEGMLRIELFDDGMVRDLAAGLGVPDPVPSGVGFTSRGVEVDLALGPAGLDIGLGAADLRTCRGPTCLALTNLKARVSRGAEGVTFEGKGTFPTGGSVEVAGSRSGQRGRFDFRFAVPDLGVFLDGAGTRVPEGLVGGLIAAGSCEEEDTGVTACGVDLSGVKPESSGGPYRLSLAPVSAGVRFEGSGAAWSGDARLSVSGEEVAGVAFGPEGIRWEMTLPSGRDTLGPVLGKGLVPDVIRGPTELRAGGELRQVGEGSFSGDGRIVLGEIGVAGGAVTDTALDFVLRLEKGTLTLDRFAAAFTTGGGSIPAAAWKLRGSGTFGSTGFRVIIEEVSTGRADYLSEDGRFGFGEGTLRFSLSAERQAPDGPVEVGITGTGEVGDILMGELYGDLRGLPWRFDLRGDVRSVLDGVTVRAATVEMGEIGSVSLRGKAARDGFQLGGNLRIGNLAGLIGPYLVPAFSPLFPALKTADVGGGMELGFDLHGGPGGYRASGDLVPRALDISLPALGLNLRGAGGSVPFDLAVGSPGPPTEPGGRKGRLTLDMLRIGFVELATRSIELSAWPNRLRLDGPLALDMAGGKVRANDLSVERTRSGGLGIETRVTVQDVDLEQLTEALGAVPFTGSIAADLGTIRYADRILASDGTASIRAFGGEMRVENLFMEEPFSRYRTVHGDLDFSGIDLHALSRTFAFGEMNGVADGYVRDLRIFGNLPSGFVARLETREEGKRDISVKALNNLTVISQGGVSAALSRGIYRFIDFYRYRRIGIDCRLENDVFQLKGTAKEGSDRYLVLGALIPPRIDITAPEQAISFKELVKRISRIDRTGGKKSD